MQRDITQLGDYDEVLTVEDMASILAILEVCGLLWLVFVGD